MDYRAIKTLKVGGKHRVPGTPSAVFEWKKSYGDPEPLVEAGVITPDISGDAELKEDEDSGEPSEGEDGESGESEPSSGENGGDDQEPEGSEEGQDEGEDRGDRDEEEGGDEGEDTDLPFAPEEVAVKELPEHLAGIDEVAVLHELQEVDSRTTAAEHYERRINELEGEDDGE